MAESHWNAVLPSRRVHLEFLGVGDFIRQTTDPIVSPIHPQPRDLLQQSLVPPSVVPEGVSFWLARQEFPMDHVIIVCFKTSSPVVVCGEDGRQRQALPLHNL